MNVPKENLLSGDTIILMANDYKLIYQQNLVMILTGCFFVYGGTIRVQNNETFVLPLMARFPLNFTDGRVYNFEA